MFQKYGIRKCTVRLDRLDVKVSTEKKHLIEPKKGNVRSNVSWIPTQSTTHKNSMKALSGLADYQTQNGILPHVVQKSVYIFS